MATWSRCMSDRRFLPWFEWVFSLLFSTFFFDSQNSTKTRTDRSGMHSHCAFVDYPTLVHETTSSTDRHISTFARGRISWASLWRGKRIQLYTKPGFLHAGCLESSAKIQEFLAKQQTLFYLRGDQELQRRVTPMSSDGFCTVVKGVRIHFSQL